MLHKTGLILLMILFASVYFLYIYTSQGTIFLSLQNISVPVKLNADDSYLISGPKCKIPNYQTLNQDVLPYFKLKDYISCSDFPLLSFIAHEGNKVVLYVNKTATAFYKVSSVNCCYSNISRPSANDSHADTQIRKSKCIAFETSVTVSEDVVAVECKDSSNKTIYSNIHATIRPQKLIKNKIKHDNNTTHISVLLIGIDSISRLNLMRSLPKTYNFLLEQDWLELKGYNKMGDNTFPNLMAILTGKNESKSYETCVYGTDSFDKCNLVWYDYRNLSYVTAYAEDEAKINTFNYHKKGFKNPPTDYYFRPYMLALEKYLRVKVIDGMRYCTGPETYGERVLNLVKDFAQTFANHLYFGQFWMNSFSHNDLNSVSRMDSKIFNLLDSLVKDQLLNNTIVFFFSDHGLRFGNFRYTTSGWLEERLPYFYIYIPNWFKETFPLHYTNLKINRERLTTPYDFYMTLQDILEISTQKYSIKKGSACPECHSLFREIENNRSCNDVAIEQHWCTCLNYRQFPVNSIVNSAVNHVIKHIHETIKIYGPKESNKCQIYKLSQVLSSSISRDIFRNDSYLLIIFKTAPGSVFEATVNLKENFTLQGDVSRLDYYQSHSRCVKDPKLKKYCYCR